MTGKKRQVEERQADELRRFEAERRAEVAAAAKSTVASEMLNVWDLLNKEYQAEKNGLKDQSASMSADHVPVPQPQDVPVEVVTQGKAAPDNGAKANTPPEYAARDQHADNRAKPSATKVKKTKENVVAPQAGPSKKVSKAENAVAPQAAPAKKKITKKEMTRYVAPPEQQAGEHLANAAVQAKHANIKATMAPEIGTEQDSATPQPAPPAKKDKSTTKTEEQKDRDQDAEDPVPATLSKAEKLRISRDQIQTAKLRHIELWKTQDVVIPAEGLVIDDLPWEKAGRQWKCAFCGAPNLRFSHRYRDGGAIACNRCKNELSLVLPGSDVK
jgi:hypothetical protein